MFIKILKSTNQIKNVKLLIVFDDMIADMFSNEKLDPIVTELFIKSRKLKLFLLFLLHNLISLFREILD